MDDSPYKSPESNENQSGDPAKEPIRLVAKYQRWVIIALLGNIGANILVLALAGQEFPIRLVALAISLAAAAFSMVAIFLLAKKLSGVAVGIICAVAMIVPCLSLIVLLVINQKATGYLQSNGVRVGFLGTNPDNI